MVQKKAEIPISFPTKQAKKDLEEVKGIFSKTFSALASIEERTGLFKSTAAGLLTAAGEVIGRPTDAFVQQGGQAAQGLISTVGVGAGAALGGTTGAIIGGIASNLVNAFIGALDAETRQVEGRAGAQAQAIIERFAAAGVAVSDKDIAELLKMFRAREKRIFDQMKQVARVQDETSNSIFGYIGTMVRRGADLII